MRTPSSPTPSTKTSSWRLLLVASCLVAFGLIACDEDPPPSCPAITVKYVDGLDNGMICAEDSECKYGICYKGELTAGAPDKGFCTKKCDCGEGSNCADDGMLTTTEPYLICQRPAGSANEPFKAFCIPQCLGSVDDCSRYGDGFTTCAQPSTGYTTRTVCRMD